MYTCPAKKSLVIYFVVCFVSIDGRTCECIELALSDSNALTKLQRASGSAEGLPEWVLRNPSAFGQVIKIIKYLDRGWLAQLEPRVVCCTSMVQQLQCQMHVHCSLKRYLLIMRMIGKMSWMSRWPPLYFSRGIAARPGTMAPLYTARTPQRPPTHRIDDLHQE